MTVISINNKKQKNIPVEEEEHHGKLPVLGLFQHNKRIHGYLILP